MIEEKMNSGSEDGRIEELLAQVEFPGENEKEVLAYLESAGIPQKVIAKITALEEKHHRMRVWAVIAAFGLFFLIVLSANKYLVQFMVSLRTAISTFLMAALGAVFLLGLIGIMRNVNYKKMERFLKDQGTKAEEFFHRMFHP